MADEIALNIEIKADRAQMSLGELQDGFDELQTRLKNTNRNTEEGRKEFKKLATQMAQTSKEIKNI
jgi:predicted transcriptional regulator